MSFEPNPSYRCQMHSVLTNLSVLKSSLVSLFQLQIYPDREEYEAQQVYFSSSKQSYVTQHCKKYSKIFSTLLSLSFSVLFKKEKVLQTLSKHHNQQALTSSIEEGLKLQALNRAQRVVSSKFCF